MLPFQRTFISSYPEATQDTQHHTTATTTDLGIGLNGKMVLYLEDLAKPKVSAYLIRNRRKAWERCMKPLRNKVNITYKNRC